MKKTNVQNIIGLVLLLLSMTFGSGVSAQTVSPAGPAPDGQVHAMTIHLKNGGKVFFSDASAIDRVTYLDGIGMKVYLKNEAYSVDYLYSEMTSIEYVTTDGGNNSNANWVDYGWTDYPEAWRLEYPHLHANVSPTKNANNSQIVVKRTDDYGITYSIEWDNAKVANRWTCYQMHAGNILSNVKRKDNFGPDPEVAVSSQLGDYSGSGFSRGHLCPSSDRLCSREQNGQTFFLTNMQPQYQNHNGVLWNNLEILVREYAANALCDTLYVVKAATITDKVTINGAEEDGIYSTKCNGRLLVPKYFYMALLSYNKASNTYKALGFWTLHENKSIKNKNYGDYAISIDELERRTGIDFFCNLPDDIEKEVEAEEPDLKYWHITKSN